MADAGVAAEAGNDRGHITHVVHDRVRSQGDSYFRLRCQRPEVASQCSRSGVERDHHARQRRGNEIWELPTDLPRHVDTLTRVGFGSDDALNVIELLRDQNDGRFDRELHQCARSGRFLAL